MSVILDLSSQQHCKIANNNDTNDDPTLYFSIGVAKNNTEDIYHANNTCFSFVSYFIIAATSTNDNGGYKFVFWKNNKYDQFVSPTTPTQHRGSLLELQETIQKTDTIWTSLFSFHFLFNYRGNK